MPELDIGLSVAPTLLHHWRELVDRVAQIVQRDAEAGTTVTGLVVVRSALQPRMLRLTHETDLGLRARIAHRIKEGLRAADRVFAVGHWEWLLVLPGLPSSAPVVLAMLKTQRLLAETPFRLPGGGAPINFSFGAAVFPDSGDDPQHLIQSARIAAAVADRLPERYAVYDRQMEITGDATQDHLEELKLAIGANTLQLYIQPQIQVASGACHHAEALLRWRLPDGTDVPAPDAIAMVEQGGLRPRFNRWLVQQGVQCVARLNEAGIPVDIGLNLTANDLLDPELPDLVEQTLALWDVAPSRILFEITETIVVADTSAVADTLGRLRRLGVRLAIDDFGTGYAGMSYLSRLPVHEVKIDQSFVRRINDSSTDFEIIASVTALAHRLGMEIVAEGVETPEVLATIGTLGCDRAQGFLFARAMPEAEFIAWWRSRN